MKYTVHLNEVDKNGMIKYNFLNLPAEEVSRINDDIGTKEKVKIKRKTFLTKDIEKVEFGN